MRTRLFAVVALLAAAALSTPSGPAAAQQCPDGSRHPLARLTIKKLHMVNQPVGHTNCFLAKGPIWDPAHPARPGQGETMVMDAHDVTPVPGYGAHGPFYRLYLLKPGDLATIKSHGVVRTYRFVTFPFAKRQCLSKDVNDLPARLEGTLLCTANDRPIKHWKVEGFYIRCCWPRYTSRQFLYERAVLISEHPIWH